MTAIAPIVPSIDDIDDPSPRRWTKTEYYRLGDLGYFQGQRAELIDGEIMVMSPLKFPHYATVDRASDALRSAFGGRYWVRQQAPLNIDLSSDPEPDVSVVLGQRQDYSAHPLAADAVLVVEVSDTTLRYDRGDKASLYARAGIADYWIIDIVHHRVEICRSPVADDSAPFGFGYVNRMHFAVDQSVSPLALPAASISVTSLIG